MTRRRLSMLCLSAGLAITCAQFISHVRWDHQPSYGIGALAGALIVFGILIADLSGPNDPPKE